MSIETPADIKVGVIGAGSRAASYLGNVPERLRKRVRLVAIAEPDPANRDLTAKRFGGSTPPRLYQDGPDLLQREELDALIITTPNHLHVRDAVPAMRRGIPLLLEKPVAVSLAECAQLWQSYVESGRPPVTVGFVLRYTPFGARLHELVSRRSVGQLLTVDADENVAASTTGAFLRGTWRRWDRLAGGFLVEKCCHDFDFLSWITGARVTRVYSIGKRTHFVPRPRAEQHARFDVEAMRTALLDYGDTDSVRLAWRSMSGDSLYDAAGDVPDHQTVMLEWSNGILSCFTACLGQVRGTRRIRIGGSDGMLEGDLERSVLLWDKPGKDAYSFTTERIEIRHDLSGHHGGDSVINESFWSSAAREPFELRAGIREGIEAVIVALAAEESERTGQPVDVTALRRQVFGEE